MQLTACTFFFAFCLANAYGQSNAVEKTLSEYAQNNNFNGTILVTQNGKPVYHQSFGYADRQYDIKNTNETRYKIASITKTFTAVLILQLYEQGKLALDKPIRQYLPDYTGEGADQVTIHHLLTHSSGIENCEKNGDAIYELPLSADEILKKYCSGKPVPQFRWGLFAFNLCGVILCVTSVIYNLPSWQATLIYGFAFIRSNSSLFIPRTRGKLSAAISGLLLKICLTS